MRTIDARAKAGNRVEAKSTGPLHRRCRHCGEKFSPAPRSGRDSKRRQAGGARAATAAQFCSSKCRQANYRWRQSQGLSRNADSGKGAGVRSAVTRHLQVIESIDELPTKNEGARPAQVAGLALSPSQWRCATLALDSETAAAVLRANREAYSGRSYLPLAGITYFRDAAILSDWKPSGDGATTPDILRFLLRGAR